MQIHLTRHAIKQEPTQLARKSLVLFDIRLCENYIRLRANAFKVCCELHVVTRQALDQDVFQIAALEPASIQTHFVSRFIVPNGLLEALGVLIEQDDMVGDVFPEADERKQSGTTGAGELDVGGGVARETAETAAVGDGAGQEVEADWLSRDGLYAGGSHFADGGGEGCERLADWVSFGFVGV